MAYKAQYDLEFSYFVTYSCKYFHLFTWSFLCWPFFLLIEWSQSHWTCWTKVHSSQVSFFRKYSLVCPSELVSLLHCLKHHNFPYRTYQNIHICILVLISGWVTKNNSCMWSYVLGEFGHWEVTLRKQGNMSQDTWDTVEGGQCVDRSVVPGDILTCFSNSTQPAGCKRKPGLTIS